MNIKYYILNGVSTAGKDTFVNMCKGYDHHRIYALQFSSVGWIKEVAEELGWDGKKDEKGRNLLSGLKHLLTIYNDIPFKKTVENVRFWVEPEDKTLVNVLDDYEYTLVFIDVREPEEIDKYKKEFNAKTILIRNPEAEAKITNESDMNVLNYNYDYVIWNDSTLDTLKKFADTFIREEIGEVYEI
jgi:guanylate kinase